MAGFGLIIVAGGAGKRMGSATAKQFMLLNDKPVLLHSIEKFLAFDPEIEIIVVLPKEHINTWKLLCEMHNFSAEHTVVNGGEQRFHSVKNGLNAIEGNLDIIAIHDAVRPFVSLKTIENAYKTAKKTGNAVPAIRPVDSIRLVNSNNESEKMNRDDLRIIQTPQVFRTKILKEAYKTDYLPHFTDDASVLEETGIKINLIEGDPYNIKITHPTDIFIAEALLASQK